MEQVAELVSNLVENDDWADILLDAASQFTDSEVSSDQNISPPNKRKMRAYTRRMKRAVVKPEPPTTDIVPKIKSCTTRALQRRMKASETLIQIKDIYGDQAVLSSVECCWYGPDGQPVPASCMASDPLRLRRDGLGRR